MPHIQNVPDRSNIEIHVGNFLKDTDGCVLLGTKYVGEALLGSHVAFNAFLAWFESIGNEASVVISSVLPLPLQMQTP